MRRCMRYSYSGFLCCRRPSLAICQQSIYRCGQTSEVKRSAGGLPVEGQLGASRRTPHITGTHRRSNDFLIRLKIIPTPCWLADHEHAKCKVDASCDRLRSGLTAHLQEFNMLLSPVINNFHPSILDCTILFSYLRHRRHCSASACQAPDIEDEKCPIKGDRGPRGRRSANRWAEEWYETC